MPSKTMRLEDVLLELQRAGGYDGFEILILDAVGVELVTDEERGYLLSLIDRRYSAFRSTILLSHLDRAGLYKCLGGRIMDRLIDSGNAAVTVWKEK